MNTLQLEYEYEVENIFEYIIESYYNGQKKAGKRDRQPVRPYWINKLFD